MFFLYNNKNFLIVFISIIILSFFIHVKAKDNKFLKMKALSSGEYFVIFENNINIYNFNFTKCYTIFTFNDSKINPTLNDLKNISISEYNQEENKLYILCLIKQYLFIYDVYNYQMKYHLVNKLLDYNNDHKNESHYYCLIPYNIKNDYNISFIISFIYNNKICFLFFSLNSFHNITFLYDKWFEEKDLEPFHEKYGSDVSPPELICHILYLGTNYLECFYTHFWRKKVKTIKFNIMSQPNSNDEKEVIKYDSYSKPYTNLMSAFSYNNQKTFFCAVDFYLNALCLDNNEEGFFQINNCLYNWNCLDLQLYFFNETEQFVLICKKDNNVFILSKLDYNSKTNNLSDICQYKIFTIYNHTLTTLFI